MPLTQLDVHIGKFFFFRRAMLGICIDLQNVAGGSSPARRADVHRVRSRILGPGRRAAARYRMKRLEQVSGTLLPRWASRSVPDPPTARNPTEFLGNGGPLSRFRFGSALHG